MTKVIFDFSEFPGWLRFDAFLESFVVAGPKFQVLDLGGGANPMLKRSAPQRTGYDLLDVDQRELSKASLTYDRIICVDATGPNEAFLAAIGDKRYDLVFSHMFLEHIQEPDQLHKNVFAALKPGGRAIHAYPCPTNIPLAINAALPEKITRMMLRFARPKRDLDGKQGKFPAYYRKCYPSSSQSRTYFEELGYHVESHKGFAGHLYYERVPVLRDLEKIHRKFVVATQVPWVCFSLLVLRKPDRT
jgi:SAM-dependent methyltransferase